MKTKLPYLFSLLPVLIFAQSPIGNYYSTPMSTYEIVTSTPAIDQSASGPNLTWNFTTLSQTGSTADAYAAPTAGELSTYPGTTSVLSITDNPMEVTKIFTKNGANQVSVTGTERPGLVFNYVTDNALIGTFPMSYNEANADNVSGTFDYTSFGFFSGTFMGTANTIVDAYGTLSTNDLGQGAFSGSVTRLKTVQNITLNSSGIIGAVIQTTYNYYKASNGDLVFRSNEINLVVPFLGLDETTSTMESLLTSTLDISENEVVSNQIKIIPNPVKDVLNIKLNRNETIRSITLTDISGRNVLTINDNVSSVKVNELQAGIYIANIITEKGVYTQKFLKK
jgi:hypothetical protein